MVAASPELEQQEPGIKTVKRWTTDIIEHNQLRNQPRMFAEGYLYMYEYFFALYSRERVLRSLLQEP